MHRSARVALAAFALAAACALPLAEGATGALGLDFLDGSLVLPARGETAARLVVSNVGPDALDVSLSVSENVLEGDAPGLRATIAPARVHLAPGERANATVTIDALPAAREGETRTLVVHATSAPGTDDRPITVRVSAPAPRPGGLDVSPVQVAAAVALAALGVGIAALARRESWRYLAASLLAPLSTRLSRGEILDNDTRSRVFEAIAREPGVRYSALLRALALPPGVLVHHLRTLERHGYVASWRERGWRRFSAVGAALPSDEPRAPTPAESRVLDLLASGPLTQREIAERLGVTRQGASYHVKRLVRAGRVEMRFEDGEWRCARADAPRRSS